MQKQEDVSDDPLDWFLKELARQPGIDRFPTLDRLAEAGFHDITRALQEQLPAIMGEDRLPDGFPPSLAAAIARCRAHLETAFAVSLQLRKLDRDSPGSRALIDGGAHGAAREEAVQALRDTCRDGADSVIALLDEFAAIQPSFQPLNGTMSEHDWNDIRAAVMQAAAAVVCHLTVLSNPDGFPRDTAPMLLTCMSLITAAAQAGMCEPLRGALDADAADAPDATEASSAAWHEEGHAELREQCEKLRAATSRA